MKHMACMYGPIKQGPVRINYNVSYQCTNYNKIIEFVRVLFLYGTLSASYRNLENTMLRYGVVHILSNHFLKILNPLALRYQFYTAIGSKLH